MMSWFNYYGSIIMAVIMIPNIIYAVKHKGEQCAYKNKAAEITEQIGRYACLVLMIFNIPYTYMGFWFSYGEIVYIAVNAAALVAYCLSWSILWKNNGLAKALLLSVLPSFVFIFSGVAIASAPLTAFAIVFAVSHILISVKNVGKDVQPPSVTS